MAAPRIGRQTPTQSVVLPYKATAGADAIELYEKTGRKAQEWQKLQMYDILATNEDGLYVHSKYGYSVPRRNGKNEIVAIRELYGLMNGQRVLHTAHRTTTSHSAWERLCKFLNDLGYKEVVRPGKDEVEALTGHAYRANKQFGLETIELYGLPGRVSFRTRSGKGGLGEGFDLLIIDEAQEYTDEQESTLKYTGASLLVADGCDLTSVSKGLGHSRVSTTLDIYTHAYREGQDALAEKMEQYMAAGND